MKETDLPSAERRAVVLLSGGLDSTTVLAMALADGFDPIALTFRYGQRHAHELASARRVTEVFGVREHVVLDLPFPAIGGSSLLGGGEIPAATPGRPPASGVVPSTYVPARNLVFLSLATALAESRSARDIYIGANAVDYSGYPDCRPAFLDAFRRAANLGTERGITHGLDWFRIHAPLTELTKADIIRRGVALGVDYALTHSCYDPDPAGRACGRCESCAFRRRGFEEAGVPDPTSYV